mgnify:CR=1 FL=1
MPYADDTENVKEESIMDNRSIYQDIAKRTGGDIYVGVVGPVRTGKSTFIKRFMDTLVLPNIENDSFRTRANDELPQSSAGKTIMTTEPKFVPEEAVEVTLEDNAVMKVRMVDCVGFIVPSSIGYIEDSNPRMVKTPWFDEEIPFDKAAEIGTQKVINEHSTIGLVVTTDGSFSEIPREEYEKAEERAINELLSINKPFIVLLNCSNPSSDASRALARDLTEKYSVPVFPVNCLEMSEKEIKEILTQILFEFPIKEISIDLPGWITSLPSDHWLKSKVYGAISESSKKMAHVRDAAILADEMNECEYIRDASINKINLGDGSVEVNAALERDLFYKIIAEQTGLEIDGEQSLMKSIKDLSESKKAFDKFKNALDEVEATGYGIVMPSLDELSLDEPEIVRQGGRYGVRLRATAPSIHMMKTNIATEVAPIVGSESQSEELVKFLLEEFSEDPSKIWESNIFGKTLNELVNEGLRNKLLHMPTEARMKFQETLERVINEGCNGLICIII